MNRGSTTKNKKAKYTVVSKPPRSARKSYLAKFDVMSYNKWTKSELKLLETMFRQMAQRSPDPEAMSKETFLSVYKLPGIFGERLFTVFDKKKSGVIDFEEFVNGLQQFLRGDVGDKAKMIFEMYDLNNNGCVDNLELSTMLHSLIPQPKGADLSASEEHRRWIHNKVEMAFKECDLNNDGKLSLEQFKLWLEKNPGYLHIMESTFREHSLLGSLNPKPPMKLGIRRNSPIIYPGSPSGKQSEPPLTPRFNFVDMPEPAIGINRNSRSWPCFDNTSLFQSEGQSEYGQKWDEVPSLDSIIRKATCHKCRIVYTFQQECDENLVKLETDPDYSVFNIQNVAGITTLIHLRACVQCRGDLHYDSGSISDESFISVQSEYKRVASPQAPLGTFGSSAAQDVDVSNPNRIVMQGVLWKRGRTVWFWKARWYVLKDKFLYHYKIAKHREGTSGEPIGAQFIQGCIAEIDEVASEKYKDKFCFILTFPDGKVKKLASKSFEERQHWVQSLQHAGESGAVSQFYRIEQIIGKGKFSLVYRCTEIKTNKKWAAKVIQKDSLSMEDKNLLRTEISIMRIVNHPYIVSLHDVYESKTTVHLIMTLINGGDLFDALKARNFVVSEQDAKIIVFKILVVLIYLHNFGIVHRDLKTENILVRNKDDPLDIMVSDFGLSKYSGPQEMMLKKVGTIAYVAPEVLLEKGYSYKVDLWSLGCIMHLLLRGYLPFDADNMNDIRDYILNAKLTFNNPRWNVISDPAKDLLKGLLEKNPSERIDFQSAEAHEWFANLDLRKQQRARRAISTTLQTARCSKEASENQDSPSNVDINSRTALTARDASKATKGDSSSCSTFEDSDGSELVIAIKASEQSNTDNNKSRNSTRLLTKVQS